MPYIKKADLEAVKLAGARMSNACYNLSQLPEGGKFVDEATLISLGKAQREWDAAKRNLPKNRAK